MSQSTAGKRGMTGEAALRYRHWFGTEPQFLLDLRAQWDFVQAEREAVKANRHLPTRTASRSEAA